MLSQGCVPCSGPSLGQQLIQEAQCCVSVLDGEERGKVEHSWLWLSPPYSASGLVSKSYLRSVSSHVKISTF